jgi:transcription initiation factor TFIIIB Brf1 subunit/transcription initiation factor TFIIB
MMSLQEHKHKLIFDENTSEQICTSCGQVSPPIPDNDIPTNGSGQQLFRNTPYYTVNQTYIPKIEGVKKLRKLDFWSMDRTGRNCILTASRYISRICIFLKLPRKVIERSMHIYRKFKGSRRGRSIICVSGACVFYVTKEYNILRTIEDVVDACKFVYAHGVNIRKVLFKYYQEIKHEIPLEAGHSISMFISKVGSNMKLDLSLIKEAIDLAAELAKKNPSIFSGRGPSPVASALLNVVTKKHGMEIRQDAFAKAGSTTTVSLRQNRDLILKNL